MKDVTMILKDQFEEIKNKTIYEVFQLTILITSISFIFGVFFASYDRQLKINLYLFYIFILMICFISLYLTRRKVRNSGVQTGVYFFVVLLFMLATYVATYQKYLVTSSVIFCVFSVIIFMTMKKELLIAQSAITTILMLGYSFFANGKSIEIGVGYVVSIGGMYLLMFICLYKGIRMYDLFEEIYHNQMHILLEKNEELGALNEEYYATEEVLRYSIDHDQMTGVLNWNGFENALEDILNYKKEFDFQIFYLDIDDFLYINNAFGYSVGNHIIKEIFRGLSQYPDVLENLSRGEGDSVLFTANNKFDTEFVMELINRVLRSIVIEESNVRIKASVGICQANRHLSAFELIRNAEVAMYQVKKDGKGSYAVHQSTYNTELNKQFAIFSAMDEAIENKEFFNLYQPKVNIRTNRIFGFEALVRWNSSKLGIVYPDQFINLSEHTGQIHELGFLIFQNAVDFAKRATEIDPDIIISINISTKQLMDENFLGRVKEYFVLKGVSTKNIAFEVTETAYIQNLNRANAVLKQINELGLEVYLDDFGTGYSSLNYLHQLPIHILKIDKSFIDFIHVKQQARDLANTILMLAKSLHIACIAEGVEDGAQLDVLRELGCEYVQGYYYDKPLTEDEALQKVHHVYQKK